jgi:hypothetical protein
MFSDSIFRFKTRREGWRTGSSSKGTCLANVRLCVQNPVPKKKKKYLEEKGMG